MTTKSTLTELTISRRTAIGMALAAMVDGRFPFRMGLASAQDEEVSTWIPSNLGQNGVMPGPGLDFEAPLGEMWRVSGEKFGRFAGYANSVFYTTSGPDFGSVSSIAAWNAIDGTHLWTFRGPAENDGGTEAGTPPVVPQSFLSPLVTIDRDVMLVGGGDDGLLQAVDARTGDLRWAITTGSRYLPGPFFVAEHVAFYLMSGGLCALDISDPPQVMWQKEVGMTEELIFGVDAGLVYVLCDADGGSKVCALATEDGSEYWRSPILDYHRLSGSIEFTEGNSIVTEGNNESQSSRLSAIGQDGQLTWSVPDDDYNPQHKWVMDGTVTRMTPTQSVYDSCRFESLLIEDGQLYWSIDIFADRWTDSIGDAVLCSGIAYALVVDSYQGHPVLLAVDPINAKVFGAQDSRLVPIAVTGGMMLARDFDTDEMVAIGPVSAVLEVGGRARITQETILRGAPGESSVERGLLTKGTSVVVTGTSETSQESTWYPVTVAETDTSGWIVADTLEGIDGDIRFVPIDISEFGQFTSYS